MKLQEFLSLMVESTQSVNVYEVICEDLDNFKTRNIVKDETVAELLFGNPELNGDVARYLSAKDREVAYFSIRLIDTRLSLSIRIK